MRRRSILVAVLVIAAVLTLSASSVGAAPAEDDPAFLVDLKEDGSATVTIRLAYDLESDTERAAFEDLNNSKSLRDDMKRDAKKQLQSVAASAENRTGREMAIEDVSINLRTVNDGSTGLVDIRATWKGLAATMDGKLVVTEPFASGFQPDRAFVITGPEGYSLAEVTPKPDEGADNRAVWNAGDDLSGFKAVFEPAEEGAGTSPAGTETGTQAPGFGFVVGLISVLIGALALGRRW